MDSPVSFAGGVNTSLRMAAVENERFVIAREDNPGIPNVIILSREEKFALYEQLEQNINIHHEITGNWYLSPRAEFMLRKEMRKGAFSIWLRMWIVSWIVGGVL